MGSMKKWMFAAAFAIGALSFTVPQAQAARIGVYIGAPAAYVPPCPGAGYVWVAGFWANGYWTPGYWNFVGVRAGGPIVRGGVAFNRGPVFYHRGFDRHVAPARFRR